MKGHPIRYSAAELAWLEANRALSIGDYHAAFVELFGRGDVSAVNLHSLRKRKGWKTGRSGQFKKGNAPHNKGKPCAPGKGGRHPNARATQFRKGNRPHTWRGVGHESISKKDGYIYMIVAETNPHTGADTRRVLKHKWLWEKLHGPVPKGMALKARDGNRQNTDPDNWELIPRALLPRLGGRFGRDYDGAPTELKPTIMAVARLEQRAHDRRKGAGLS